MERSDILTISNFPTHEMVHLSIYLGQLLSAMFHHFQCIDLVLIFFNSLLISIFMLFWRKQFPNFNFRVFIPYIYIIPYILFHIYINTYMFIIYFSTLSLYCVLNSHMIVVVFVRFHKTFCIQDYIT